LYLNIECLPHRDEPSLELCLEVEERLIAGESPHEKFLGVGGGYRPVEIDKDLTFECKAGMIATVRQKSTPVRE
jgi:hypothetical protein